MTSKLSGEQVLARALELLVARTDSDVRAELGAHVRRPRASHAGMLTRIAVGSNAERVLTRLEIEPRPTASEHPLARAAADVLESHGAALCAPEKPNCEACPLVSFCRKGRNRVAQSTAELPTVVDMFAGVGGLGRGFQDAGFRLAGAFERNREAAQTYRLNHPGVPVIEDDVSTLSAASIRDALVRKEIDVLVAGPPCQGYSAAGKRAVDDERNFMFRHVVRIANELDVSAITIENVPGARSLGDVPFAKQIVAELRRAGFATESDPATLRASEFGVPQGRRRLFFLAARRGAPQAPDATHARQGQPTNGLPQTRSVLHTLLDLPELRPGQGGHRTVVHGRAIFNHRAMAHTKPVLDKISSIVPGSGPMSYRRLHSDEARTLVAGHRALPVHPTEDRTITAREAARLQGFPDDYVFCGPHASQPLQVANAVPPPLARAVANAIKEHLMCAADD